MATIRVKNPESSSIVINLVGRDVTLIRGQEADLTVMLEDKTVVHPKQVVQLIESGRIEVVNWYGANEIEVEAPAVEVAEETPKQNQGRKRNRNQQAEKSAKAVPNFLDEPNKD